MLAGRRMKDCMPARGMREAVWKSDEKVLVGRGVREFSWKRKTDCWKRVNIFWLEEGS